MKNKPKNIDFGKRLRVLREKLDLKQTEAALKIGVSYSGYQSYETGIVPKKSTVSKICEFFKCNMNWLLTGEGKAMTEKIEPYGRYPDPDEDAIDKPESKVIPYYIGETRGMDYNAECMRLLANIVESKDERLLKITLGVLRTVAETVALHEMPKKREEAA